MLLSTKVLGAALICGTTGYLHGLLGAILAERHIEHIASWAGGVSTLLGFCTVQLGIFARIVRIAEQAFVQSQLDAENRLKWERANQVQLAVNARKSIEGESSASIDR